MRGRPTKQFEKNAGGLFMPFFHFGIGVRRPYHLRIGDHSPIRYADKNVFLLKFADKVEYRREL